MNWHDDPVLRDEIAEQIARSGIMRSAILWTPPFLLCLAGFLYFLADLVFGWGNGGIVLVIVIGGITFLFGFQAVQAIQDLRGQPAEIEEVVTRRWHKNDSIVLRTHYVRLGRGLILRGDKGLMERIEEGDRVAVRYYPNSAVLIGIKRLPDKEPEAAAAADPPRV